MNPIRWTLATVVLLLSGICCSAQDITKTRSANTLAFSEGSSLISYSGFLGLYQVHEVRYEYMVHNRWSVMYRAGYSFRQNTLQDLGPTPDDEIIAPSGLIMCCALGAATSSCGSTLPLESIDWLLYAPDGIAYHIPMGMGADFSPYIMPAAVALHRNGENNRKLVYAPSAGVRILYPLTPHIMINLEQRIKHTGGGTFEATPGMGLSGWF
ncbi:MAG: hypothetical protein JNM00_00690 [Flavobacteriales bacterium]|nr:hypothetical protein [Flavobacteriales bacterium]